MAENKVPDVMKGYERAQLCLEACRGIPTARLASLGQMFENARLLAKEHMEVFPCDNLDCGSSICDAARRITEFFQKARPPMPNTPKDATDVYDDVADRFWMESQVPPGLTVKHISCVLRAKFIQRHEAEAMADSLYGWLTSELPVGHWENSKEPGVVVARRVREERNQRTRGGQQATSNVE
jgi:hypothetical protein